MGTEKGIFDHGMKGMLPAHPLSPATLKESTIRAQLLLFKNKTEEEEEKDEENCRLLLKAGCGRRRSGVSQSWGTQSRLLSGRDEKTVSELGVYPGHGDWTVR